MTRLYPLLLAFVCGGATVVILYPEPPAWDIVCRPAVKTVRM